MIDLPKTSESVLETWKWLLASAEKLPDGWTIVGGQMIHLFAAEYNRIPPRATDDLDVVMDIRVRKTTHYDFTKLLADSGFKALTTPDGVQHRWVSQWGGQVDVLRPRNLGNRILSRVGYWGGETVETPGAQQALDRSERIAVRLPSGQIGYLNRPELLGAMIIKAAAFSSKLGVNYERHLADFSFLATLASSPRLIDRASRKERGRIIDIVMKSKEYPHIVSDVNGSRDALDSFARRIEQINHIESKNTTEQNKAIQAERRTEKQPLQIEGICGMITQSGRPCIRPVNGHARCYQHKRSQ